MKKSDLIMSFGVVRELHEKFNPSDEAMDVWMMVCGDHSTEDFRKALLEHLATSPFQPMPSHINDIIARGRSRAMTGTEAFRLIQEALSRFGFYRANEAVKWLPPLVSRAIGGEEGFKSFCLGNVSNFTTFRAQFIKSFDTLSQREFNQELTTGARALSSNEKEVLKLITK